MLFIFLLIFYYVQYKNINKKLDNLIEVNSLFSTKTDIIDSKVDMTNILYQLNLSSAENTETGNIFSINDKSTPVLNAKSNIIKIIVNKNYGTDNSNDLYMSKLVNTINVGEGPSSIYLSNNLDQKKRILTTAWQGILIPKYTNIPINSQLINPVSFVMKENEQILIVSYDVYQKQNTVFIPIGYVNIAIYYNN